MFFSFVGFQSRILIGRRFKWFGGKSRGCKFEFRGNKSFFSSPNTNHHQTQTAVSEPMDNNTEPSDTDQPDAPSACEAPRIAQWRMQVSALFLDARFYSQLLTSTQCNTCDVSPGRSLEHHKRAERRKLAAFRCSCGRGLHRNQLVRRRAA